MAVNGTHNVRNMRSEQVRPKNRENTFTHIFPWKQPKNTNYQRVCAVPHLPVHCHDEDDEEVANEANQNHDGKNGGDDDTDFLFERFRLVVVVDPFKVNVHELFLQQWRRRRRKQRSRIYSSRSRTTNGNGWCYSGGGGRSSGK